VPGGSALDSGSRSGIHPNGLVKPNRWQLTGTVGIRMTPPNQWVGHRQSDSVTYGAVMSDEEPGSNTVLLETANPFDLSPDELLDLAESLAAQVPTASFEVGYEDQHGAGGPWAQVLYVWIHIEFARQVGYDVMVDVCKDWLQEKFQLAHGKRRPKVLNIIDRDTGLTVLSVRVDDEDSDYRVEVVEAIPRKRPRGRHRRGE
jgi:hypothetical protein